MIYLDLDDTLFSTSHLKAFLKTNEGRRYLAENISNYETPIYKELEEIIKNFEVTILTDSPEIYARAILDKHRLYLPLIANAKKPFVNLNIDSNSLIIGDSAKDILTGHKLRIPNIGVTWGYSTENKLKQAEATRIADTPKKLVEIVDEWSSGKIDYLPRQKTKSYTLIPKKEWGTPKPNIEIIALGEYHKWVPGQRHENSTKILDFKSMKDISMKNIREGEHSKFFHDGQMQKGREYFDVYNEFSKNLKTVLGCLEESTLLAAPNSLPYFCYKTDINKKIIAEISEKTSHKIPEFRTVYRVYPKRESHEGTRNLEIQLATLGIKNCDVSTDRIAIFDDVVTSGNQMEAIARLLRYAGFSGKMTAIALGRNTAD